MSAWVRVPCLLALRDEFDKVSPRRDKGADGTIGDSAHTSSSDHTPDEDSDVLRGKDADHVNEVHALDIDSSGPWPAAGWFNRTILALVDREKAEYESATIVGRLQNVIWNRRIASRSWGWTWRPYDGADPHANHAHFSARYTTAQEQDTRSWGVNDEDDMPTADEVADKVIEKLYKVTTQTDGSGTPSTVGGQRFWNQGVPDGTDGQKHMAWQVLRNLGVAVKAVAGQVGVSADQLAEAISQVDEQVLAGLAEAGRSDDEVAASLRAALGDRAAAVGRLLAGA